MGDSFSIADLIEAMRIGHEIEFCFDGDYFFIQPDYEYDKSHFEGKKYEAHYILDKCKSFYDNQAQRIYSGTCDEILHFHIKDDLSIIHNFEKFTVLCIL